MTSGSGPYCCISSKMMILSARGSGATDGNCQVSGYEHIPAPSKRLLLGTNFALQLSTSGPSSFWVTSHGFVVDELRRWWPANFQTQQPPEVWPFQTWTFCTPWEGEWTWFECIFLIAISRKSLASASQASLSASLMRACNCAEEGCIQSWLRKRWSCAVDWGCWIYGGHWKFEEIKRQPIWITHPANKWNITSTSSYHFSYPESFGFLSRKTLSRVPNLDGHFNDISRINTLYTYSVGFLAEICLILFWVVQNRAPLGARTQAPKNLVLALAGSIPIIRFIKCEPLCWFLNRILNSDFGLLKPHFFWWNPEIFSHLLGEGC